MISLISFNLLQTLIPTPRFVFSPGFTIQTFPGDCFSLKALFIEGSFDEQEVSLCCSVS